MCPHHLFRLLKFCPPGGKADDMDRNPQMGCCCGALIANMPSLRAFQVLFGRLHGATPLLLGARPWLRTGGGLAALPSASMTMVTALASPGTWWAAATGTSGSRGDGKGVVADTWLPQTPFRCPGCGM